VLEFIENTFKEFFSKMLINIEEININEESENIFNVKIKTPDSWIVIGPSWKNLENIRFIIKNILWKKFDKNIIIHLDVNNYFQEKEEKLLNFIKSKIEIVEKTWKDIKLPFFSSYERKKIHSFVSSLQNNNIYTKSIWEWKDRRLHICKKEEKITIDIDWIDI